MNELFREARQHGAVPLNEATRASGDDKSKVRAEVLRLNMLSVYLICYRFLYYLQTLFLCVFLFQIFPLFFKVYNFLLIKH